MHSYKMMPIHTQHHCYWGSKNLKQKEEGWRPHRKVLSTFTPLEFLSQTVGLCRFRFVPIQFTLHCEICSGELILILVTLAWFSGLGWCTFQR